MRALVVYYSRTGNTKTLGHRIADALGAEIDEITEVRDRRGFLGYLRSGAEASLRRRTELVPSTVDPNTFDLVVIGTPVWNASLSSPVRAYIADHAKALPAVAFFCTLGGRGSSRVFRQMEEACGKRPIATLARTERELVHRDRTDALGTFVSRLHAAMPAVAPAPTPVPTA